MRHRPFVIACAGVVLAAAGLLLGPAAGAQEGRGIITLEATHPAGTSVHFIVRVTSASDGRPATGAIVTATAVDSDGTRLTPVTLVPADNDGRYANAIDFGSPGTWTIRFASVNPTGRAAITQTVEAGGAGGSDSGDSGGTFAPADDNTGASGAASGSGDDGGMPVWLIVAAAVVAFGGAFLGLRTVRRYRSEAASEEAQLADLETARSAGEGSEAAGGAPPRAEA